jgi:hypothetical protein
MSIPDYITNIIEPFAGNGDLVEFIEKNRSDCNVECYDIEPKKDYITINHFVIYSFRVYI